MAYSPGTLSCSSAEYSPSVCSLITTRSMFLCLTVSATSPSRERTETTFAYRSNSSLGTFYKKKLISDIKKVYHLCYPHTHRKFNSSLQTSHQNFLILFLILKLMIIKMNRNIHARKYIDSVIQYTSQVLLYVPDRSNSSGTFSLETYKKKFQYQKFLNI